MSKRRVTVKYTKDVEAFSRHPEDGSVTISKGTVREVDLRSAKHLVKSGNVELVGKADEKAEAREALKATESGGAA